VGPYTLKPLPSMRHQVKQLSKWIEEMQAFIKAEEQKPMQYTDFHAISAVEIALDALSDCVDYDPTPQFLYDHSGGEPVMSARELHDKALQTHQDLHT
jgi:hypothetical protein